MAIICHSHKLLFIMVPTTGCSTIGEVLKKQFGGEKLGHKHCGLEYLKDMGLISAGELQSYLTFATVRNPFDRFASHYQRLAGTWMETTLERHGETWGAGRGKLFKAWLRWSKSREIKRARSIDFETWLSRQIKQTDRLDRRLRQFGRKLRGKKVRRGAYRAYPLIDGVDEVMRYENLEEDLNNVLRKVGITEHVSLPRLNVTPGKKSYQEYYSPQARAMLEEWLGDELDRFDYAFEEPVESSSEMPVS